MKSMTWSANSPNLESTRKCTEETFLKFHEKVISTKEEDLSTSIRESWNDSDKEI